MPDYVYLLENRLSADQQNALHILREAARDAELLLFLTGDAVRDLTSGHAVRDLEVALQGNALKLKKKLEKAHAKIWGEDETLRTLYLAFPGTVRVDLISTHRVDYPKLGHPVYSFATIQDDLRRRDFTANAMAISLNEGSYGLLMDPLNGAADIEARTLRLVSNYGFLEDPSLLLRATRFKVRLGWELDPRSQQRYENAKEEDAINHLSKLARNRELEQIGHEDDGLKILEAYEAEGWMKHLFPAWTRAKADVAKLNALHDLRVELLLQGVHADMSAAQMQLLTTKLQPKDLSALKKALLRPGFVEEWNSLDTAAAGFAKVLLAKENQQPSKLYKLFTTYDPEAVLWLGFTAKESSIKNRYEKFLKEWPQVKQQIPYALLLEMRIKPELPFYNDLVHSIFLELIDGKLTTPEEMKAFLEPHSPPPPPPPPTIKRQRGRRAAEARVKDYDEDEEESVRTPSDEDLDDMGGDDDIGLGIPKVDMDEEDADEESEEPEEADEEEEASVPAKAKRAAPALKPAPAKSSKPEPKPAPAPAKAAHGPAKAAPVAAKTMEHAPKKTAAPTKTVHTPAKAPAKKATPVKGKPAPAKKAAKPAPKPATKKTVSKPPAKKASVKKASSKVASHKPKKVMPAKPKSKPHKPAKPGKKHAKKR